MCGKGRDVPAFGVKFELMVAGCEIECAEYSGAVEICDKVIKRRHQVLFSFLSFVCFPHINAETNFSRFLRYYNEWTDPWCGAFDLLDDVQFFQALKLFFNVFANMTGDAAMGLLLRLDVGINVQLDFLVFYFTNSGEQVSELFFRRCAGPVPSCVDSDL